MAVQLSLIRDSESDQQPGHEGEEQYRFPVRDEMWEVSCEFDRLEPEPPAPAGNGGSSGDDR